MEKKKGKYKPYDQFLAEQGQYIKKNHPTIDEDGLKWIYEAWTDYITSDFLEVLYAYIHLKENDQLG